MLHLRGVGQEAACCCRRGQSFLSKRGAGNRLGMYTQRPAVAEAKPWEFLKKWSKKSVSRVLSLPPVTRGGGDDHSSRAVVAGSLERPNPEASDGPSSNASLFGLAPDGVYQASDVATGTGELLPRHFTLTLHERAVSFLWHFPWGRPRSPLGTIPPCGARTFLPPALRRTGDHLSFFDHPSESILPLPAASRPAGCRGSGCSGGSTGSRG